MTLLILMFVLGGLILLFNAVQHPEMSIVQFFNYTVIQGNWGR